MSSNSINDDQRLAPEESILAEVTVSVWRREWIRKWVVLISAAESFVETGLKIAAAYFTGSTGLLADCIHSSADVIGSVMVWIGVRLATNKYKKFPYGFYKIENLLALAIGLAILYGAYEILQIFFAGKAELPHNIPIGISAVVLGMLLDFFWGRFEAKSGRLINSPGIEASGNHTVSDVYSSSIVLVGLVGSFFGYNLDRWAALLVAFIIGKIGIEILWKNIRALLDMTLPAEKLDAYTKLVSRQPGVLSIKSIRGRNSGSFRFVDIDLGLKAYNLSAANSIASNVEKTLKDHDNTIDSVFVHYSHDLPERVSLVIPTDEQGETISTHFGKSTHLTFFTYERESGRLSNKQTEKNQFGDDMEHRGINLALYLIDRGIDSVCCREDLHDKGPGLMFYRFGIDVRKTEETDMASLLADYFKKSASVFPEGGE
jgi:cation diffusion facilitator family transporter